MNIIEQLTQAVAAVTLSSGKGCRIVSLTYRTQEKKNKAGVVVQGGELARYTVLLGVDIEKAYRRDVRIAGSILGGLQAYYNRLAATDAAAAELAKLARYIPASLRPSDDAQEDRAVKLATLDTRILAAREVCDSLKTSLHVGIGNNPAYTKQDVYASVCDGIKVHRETGELYVFGFRASKVVLEKGVYKHVNSAPLTIAKNEVRAKLRTGSFREFRLSNLHEVKADGNRLVLVA